MRAQGDCSLCGNPMDSTTILCGMLCLKGCGGKLHACRQCGDEYPSTTREAAMFIRLEEEHRCAAEANSAAA